jgi:type III secretion protein J
MHEHRSLRVLIRALLTLLSGCNTEILHDVSEAEANEVLVALQQQGIPTEKVRSGEGNKTSYTLRVGRGDAVKAWRVLRQESLPRPKQKGLGEVFGQAGLVPTATQERAMMYQALAGEIARTLQSVEGVREARVHVVLPQRDPLSPADGPQSAPRASVLLRTTSPPPLSKEEVQKLVAGSVDGLALDAVTVLLVTGQGLPQAKQTAATLARVGPFLVAEGSRTALRVALVGSMALLLLMSVALFLLIRRNRALRTLAIRPSAERSAALSGSLESSLGIVSRSILRAGSVSGSRDKL